MTVYSITMDSIYFIYTSLDIDSIAIHKWLRTSKI